MPTQTVNLDDTKDQFSELIASAAEGSEVVIVDNGKVLALIPATDSALYKSYPPTTAEFSSAEESLAWDADGWESVA